MRVLLLAGTGEARELSHRLDEAAGVEVVVSLAGRTSRAAGHGGTVREGGFGGAGGLAQYLTDERIDALVDATHPFAATISAHAAEAALRSGVRRVQLVRPPWVPTGADRWIEVADTAGAVRAISDVCSERVLLTIGRQELAAFEGVDGVHLVVRTIEATAGAGVLPDAHFVEDRGPFTVTDELALLRHHRIDALVTKNSGGDASKLLAARQLQLPVVMIRRPPAVTGDTVSDVDEALGWLRRSGG